MAYHSPGGSVIKEGAAGFGSVAPSFGLPARYSPAVASRAMAAAMRASCPQDCTDDFQVGILTATGRMACCSGKFPGGYSWSDFEACVSAAKKGIPDAIECLAWYRDQGYITPKGFFVLTKMRRRPMHGIGEFFDAGPGQHAPWAGAYQDGIFSDGGVIEPGELHAYKDGSLGQYEQARAGGGDIHAFREGILGAYEQAAAGIGFDQAAAGLGLPLYVDGQQVDRPMTIYHGPAGVGRLGHVWARHESYRGLGQAASGTLDLTDPATVREVKTALSFANPDITLTEEGQKLYTESWYASPIWDKVTSELMASFLAQATSPPSTYKESDLAVTTDKGSYPTAAGVMTILAVGVGSPGYGKDPTYFQTNFPILSAFAGQVAAAGGDTTKVDVKAPYFTESEKVKGKGGIPVSTMAIVGLGAVAAVAAYLVLKKK
jgi:hypothetical protein